jgi:hypothetical protein
MCRIITHPIELYFYRANVKYASLKLTWDKMVINTMSFLEAIREQKNSRLSFRSVDCQGRYLELTNFILDGLNPISGNGVRTVSYHKA